MSRKPAEMPVKGAFEIVEEAFSLVRHNSLQALAGYYLGSLPFVTALLFFWADMSKSAFARDRLPGDAALLAVLFLWMKVWHAVYCRGLWTELAGTDRLRWTPGRIFRAAIRQGIVQPLGMLLLPAALLATLPFPWVYAFYQTATVIEDGEPTALSEFSRKASRLAFAWPKQNMFLIWALSPFLMVVAVAFYTALIPIASATTPVWTRGLLAFYSGLYMIVLLPLNPFGIVVAVNIGSAILIAPQLVKILFGVQTALVHNPLGMLNSTFFAVVCGLTYLCMDPLLKAAYVLRVFYAEGAHTGIDLKIALRRASVVRASTLAKLLILGIFLGFSLLIGKTAQAETSSPNAAPTITRAELSVNARELNAALDHELEGRLYAWRMPAAKKVAENENALVRFFRWLGQHFESLIHKVAGWLRKISDWFSRHALGERLRPAVNLSDAALVLRFVLYALLACLVVVLCVAAWRMWKGASKKPSELIAHALDVKPDLVDENTTADVLPETGWRALAEEALSRGELRLALRALFLAELAHLAESGFIRIARFKSNWDYKREIARRAHARPEVLELFSQSATIYEAVWYGMHETTQELYDSVMANQEELRAKVQSV